MIIIALLAVTLLMVLIPVAILFVVLELTVKSILSLAVLVAKLMVPVVIICLILFFIWGWGKRLKMAVIGLAAIRILLVVYMLTATVKPDLPQRAEVRSLAFSQGRYLEGFEVWNQGEEEVTEDLSYLDWMYQELNSHTYTRIYPEFVNQGELETVCRARILDGEGRELTTITLYGSTYLSVGDRYYRVSGDERISNDSMVHLAQARQEALAIGEWDLFLEEFEESVYYSDGAIYFTIPMEHPEGDFRITTDITASYRDEDRHVHTYPVELPWDQEEHQTWEPGKEYGIDLGDKKYKIFYLCLSTGSYTLEVNVRDLLPAEYWRYD